ncbi:MAG: DNA polymerase III subunit alpha [Candidatus Omnitrophica bacterium CG11_big_fil_rev_8_21_14_0_20_64_10]|nr:MAG: DNA polymerase III subunit alpha [Candidatus Omnitrophica bacterium CG11_big_fil_rev_8_21_14_0_20_64_10]
MSKLDADFVHLHVHSEFSLLDGACRLPELAAAAKRHGMPALALTDHGNLFGAIPFYQACLKEGVNPIIGVEAYISPGSRQDRGTSKEIPEASFHLILLAKNRTGYQNLLKLISLANLEGFYYKPRIDKEILAQHSEGLICLSSCLQGEVSYWLARGEAKRAEQAAGELAALFPKGDFYLEIQDHGIPEQRKIIVPMVQLAQKLDLGLIATNDMHYLEKRHARSHECLLCIQTGTNLDDPNRFHFDTDEFYFKSPDQMKKLFTEVPQAVLNTRQVAEKVKLELEFGKLHLPNFTPPEGKSQQGYLKELVAEGVKRRYPKAGPEVAERVERELKVITQAGFTSYFLIMWDVIRFAKSKGIPVGPGRGSAAGSVVSYCLGITDLDPIQHKLIFERFLNPDRISMPDIDIDYCYERRPEVLDYVNNKYGRGNVAQVITFGTMQAKAVVRDVARSLGFTYGEGDRIAKLIPFELGMTLQKALAASPELKRVMESDSKVKRLFEISQDLEGLTRHASTHAAGVVIADGDLTDYVPLFKSSENQITTGYSMEALEKIGLLKMDFLGLRTLTVIEEAGQLIGAGSGKPFDIKAIALDDAKTYEMLARAEATGVFQMESSGMRDLLRRLKPEHFEDLVALVALFRPGPIGSGMLDDFIRRRHGEIQVKYEHPDLEPVLKDTYGTILFQEQVMQIAHVLAGFTLAQGDTLRKAMGKKIPQVMAKAREDFILGCVRNRVSKRLAETIFEKIEYFAGYAFNRSHSAAYALIAYQTAYLKANYPVEFMTALLTSERGNTDKVALYVNEARRMGIEVLPPDVNSSFARFTVDQGRIRFGLTAIKNVGEKAIESIVEARQEAGPFKSLVDFCQRVDNRLNNRKVMESLIKCGAFDSLKAHRAQWMAVLDRALELAASRGREKGAGQLSFFDVFGDASPAAEGLTLPEVEEWPAGQLLAYEKSLLGFYLTGHPLDRYQGLFQLMRPVRIEELANLPDGKEVTVAGLLAKTKLTTTKRTNERMAILTLEDFSGAVEALVFPQVFPKVEGALSADGVVWLSARLSLREDQPKLLVEGMAGIEEALTDRAERLKIRLAPDMPKENLKQLKDLLARHNGPLPVDLFLGEGEKKSARVAVGSALHITPSVEFFSELLALVPAEQAVLQMRPAAAAAPRERFRRPVPAR